MSADPEHEAMLQAQHEEFLRFQRDPAFRAQRLAERRRLRDARMQVIDDPEAQDDLEVHQIVRGGVWGRSDASVLVTTPDPQPEPEAPMELPAERPFEAPKGFYKMPRWLAARSDLPSGAKAVLAFLDAYPEGAIIQPRQQTIAAAVGCSLHSVNRHVERLRRAGLLETKRKVRGTMRYTVLRPKA